MFLVSFLRNQTTTHLWPALVLDRRGVRYEHHSDQTPKFGDLLKALRARELALIGLMTHLAHRLDPPAILLHRYGHLPIVHIQSQLQDSIAIVLPTCLVAFTARR